jgi:hypothetical protein
VTIRTKILQRLSSSYGGGSVEDLGLSLLALRKDAAGPRLLLEAQHPTGAWSAASGVESLSAFHTALALLAIRPFEGPSITNAADHGFNWLAGIRGIESHWLWRWKFRLFDKQVRFDPLKSGWPWTPGTVSWVAPTALSILAFRAWHRESPRIQTAVAMLVDRACPNGGWNAGNSVAFGVALDPHPDFTAMAVLALSESEQTHDAPVGRSLNYLSSRLIGAASPYSLAWATLALCANDHPGATPLRAQLERVVAARYETLPVRVLALAALALEDPPFVLWEAH